MPTTDSTHSLKLCVILGRVYFLFQREKSATNTNLCHETNANEMKNHAHVRITCECSYVWQLHRHTGRYNRDEIQRKDVLWCLRSQVNKINLLYLGDANWLLFSFTLLHPLSLDYSLSHLIYNTYVFMLCCENEPLYRQRHQKTPKKCRIFVSFGAKQLLRRNRLGKNDNMKIVMKSLSSSWSSSVTIIKCIYYVSVRCTHTMIQHFTKMEVAPSFQHITIA